jgi:hypothetical protein
MTTVVLNAMGVLHRHGNVVKNLLQPYLQSKGCDAPPTTVLPLLEQLASAGTRLACLTNDTAEWSTILRQRFGLNRYSGRAQSPPRAGAGSADRIVQQRRHGSASGAVRRPASAHHAGAGSIAGTGKLTGGRGGWIGTVPSSVTSRLEVRTHDRCSAVGAPSPVVTGGRLT